MAGNVRARLERAVTCLDGGTPDEALRLTAAVLAEDPAQPAALHLAGVAAVMRGDAAAARRLIDRSLRVYPLLEAQLNFARLCTGAGDHQMAAQAWQRALALGADPLTALIGLERALLGLGDFTRAAAICRKAVALAPALVEIVNDLVCALYNRNQLAAAERTIRRAIRLHPDLAVLHDNLGNILRRAGQADAALAAFAAAIARDPGCAQARLSHTVLLLARGAIPAAWKDYACRWLTPRPPERQRTFDKPRWDGSPLPGRLFVWSEQGVGDEVAYAPLAAAVAEGGPECILECDPRLVPLFARSFPALAVVPRAGLSGPCALGDDVAAQIESADLLPWLRPTLEDFAIAGPWLRADPARCAALRAGYATDDRPLVGLAWRSGSPVHGPTRSLPDSALHRLLAVTGVHWISLQYDAPAAPADSAASALVIDPAVDQGRDLDAFAAQVAAMDLVVSIDNSAAHFAAALGIPLWLMLSPNADWRWFADRYDHRPHRPLIRRFRQQPARDGAGDWDGVASRIVTALEALYVS